MRDDRPGNDRRGDDPAATMAVVTRRSTAIATGYVVTSSALAAVVFLTHLTYINGWFALMALNLPVSLPAYFVVYVITVAFDTGDKDLIAVRVACFVIWMALVVAQAVLAVWICRQAQTGRRQPLR